MFNNDAADGSGSGRPIHKNAPITYLYALLDFWQDVLLVDMLGDVIADMALSTDEARGLLLVLGATRETIYERVLWRLAVDEAKELARRH